MFKTSLFTQQCEKKGDKKNLQMVAFDSYIKLIEYILTFKLKNLIVGSLFKTSPLQDYRVLQI